MNPKSNLPVSPCETAATRTPAQVAADINSIKFQTSAVLAEASRMAKRSAVAIGKLLEEAKCLVPHGEWGAWLRDNVEYSESTANNLMRCYREYGDEQIDMISGVSDAEFYEVLNQSQMVELFALPKVDRRAFVEEHREALESGEMSVRALKEEIARLKEENGRQAEDIRFNDETYNNLLEEHKKQGEELAALRSATPSETMVQEVIVNQPSEAQMEAVRAEVTEQLRAEFEEERAKTLKECREEISAMEKERDKAVEKAEQEANDSGELAAKLEKVQADHKAAVDKLNAAHEKKLAELEASYKKQAKAYAAGADANVTRIQISLENFKRDLTTVSGILGKMRAEGGEQVLKADKLQANVEKILGGLISEAGWTV